MSVHFKSPSYSFFKVKKEPQECSKPQRKNSSLRIRSIFYPFMPQSCSSYHSIFDPIGNCNVIAYWQEKMKIKLNHTPRFYALYDTRLVKAPTFFTTMHCIKKEPTMQPYVCLEFFLQLSTHTYIGSYHAQDENKNVWQFVFEISLKLANQKRLQLHSR